MVMEAEIDRKTIQMPKKIHYYVILTSYSRSRPIGHDQPRLVSEILAYALFGIQ